MKKLCQLGSAPWLLELEVEIDEGLMDLCEML